MVTDCALRHIHAPAINPTERINVTIQLMMLRRLVLKNDENLDIR